MKKHFTGLCLAGGLILTQMTGCGQKSAVSGSAASESTQETVSPGTDTKEITDITITSDLGEGGNRRQYFRSF